MKVRVNPRSIGAEGPYITTDVRKLARLKRRVIAKGVAPEQAAGLVSWLVDKAAELPDLTSAPTRSRYRKILAELEQDDPGRGQGDRGLTRLRPAACTAMTAVATLSIVKGQPALAAALAPIILVMSSEGRGKPSAGTGPRNPSPTALSSQSAPVGELLRIPTSGAWLLVAGV